MTTSIKGRCANREQEAIAYLEQAKDFYKATVAASVSSARPLLLYYCFMNLAKAYCIMWDPTVILDKAMHGLSEKLATPGRELEDAFLEAYRSHAGAPANVFDAFWQALTGGVGLATNTRLDVVRLLPQVVPGHRLWAEAADEPERFVALHDIKFRHSPSTHTMWLSLYLFADDLSRLAVPHKRFLDETRLAGRFHEVKYSGSVSGRRLMCLDSVACPRYSSRLSDALDRLITVPVKNSLWTTVASIPPYRRYYLYMAPLRDHQQVLPQLLSIYAVMYYLGSITRYRPHHFDSILGGPYGTRVLEFIDGQPMQFIYLLASEFAEREVTKPSIV
jgi:hypothetical protein